MNGAFDVVIVERREVAPGHVELMVESPVLAAAQPGQFCHILTPGMLRRPISFSRIHPHERLVGLLIQEVGPGTAWILDRGPGEILDVMGPLGHGFSPPDGEAGWCLVGGGVGIPPLFTAVERWPETPADVIIGARSHDLLLMAEDFRPRVASLTLATEDGTAGIAGTVMNPLRDWQAAHPGGQIYACGPTAMLAAIWRTSRGRAGRTVLALEQRMGCGIGACLACVVLAEGPSGPRYRRVCTEGPVFDAEELIFG